MKNLVLKLKCPLCGKLGSDMIELPNTVTMNPAEDASDNLELNAKKCRSCGFVALYQK